ncbi:hypothetical protein CEXT_238881 [Caerostris extrusa]|uniref:Uncharacterized protein n=1 Tax=Caerostris extrusa TaxID=172846 RepID=A0AAV4R8S9_CAEEX|nr:hypothetical protein CEXT_238881 [Caerostris extrusa]
MEVNKISCLVNTLQNIKKEISTIKDVKELVAGLKHEDSSQLLQKAETSPLSLLSKKLMPFLMTWSFFPMKTQNLMIILKSEDSVSTFISYNSLSSINQPKRCHEFHSQTKCLEITWVLTRYQIEACCTSNWFGVSTLHVSKVGTKFKMYWKLQFSCVSTMTDRFNPIGVIRGVTRSPRSMTVNQEERPTIVKLSQGRLSSKTMLILLGMVSSGAVHKPDCSVWCLLEQCINQIARYGVFWSSA